MILSDREIRIFVEQRRIIISPVPPASAWSSTAVDLSLSHKLLEWKTFSSNPAMGYWPKFCPGIPNFNVNTIIRENTKEVTISYDVPYQLEKGAFILAWTVEKVYLPVSSRIAARVEGKSSLARLGLGVHVTAPTIHAGFGLAVTRDLKAKTPQEQGLPIQLEIWNAGPLPIALVPNMRICQIIFEEVHGTPEQGNSGQFVGQGPTPD